MDLFLMVLKGSGSRSDHTGQLALLVNVWRSVHRLGGCRPPLHWFHWQQEGPPLVMNLSRGSTTTLIRSPRQWGFMDPSHVRDIPLAISVITVSTSRDESTDRSGPVIRDLLSSSSLPMVRSRIVPDDIEEIRRELFASLEVANCVIFTGGTGLTSDDCTIEAIEPLLEKTMPGFGELFRSLSVRDIGTRALLSRALGGVTRGKAVFCIPGSVGGADLAVRELIIPQLKHILTHASQ